jgi:acetyltransferase
MATYPEHLIREHRLPDGRAVIIRPIRCSETERVRAFINGLSAEARYLRFQKWIRAPSDSLVHFLTEVDYDRHMAFVCATQLDGHEELVGDARYVIDSDGSACEFGIVIADAWHKTGIAGLLMEALIRAAREQGLARMYGIVLTCNATMLRFARAFGFTVKAVPEDPTTVRIVKELAARLPRASDLTVAHDPSLGGTSRAA